MGVGHEAWQRARKGGYDLDLVPQSPVAGGDFWLKGPREFSQVHREYQGERWADPEEGRDCRLLQGRKPKVQLRHFDGTVALSEFLQHFCLVAELNGWTDREKDMYLEVSLVEGSTSKGYNQLLKALERRYQQANQAALYSTQL